MPGPWILASCGMRHSHSHRAPYVPIPLGHRQSLTRPFMHTQRIHIQPSTSSFIICFNASFIFIRKLMEKYLLAVKAHFLTEPERMCPCDSHSTFLYTCPATQMARGRPIGQQARAQFIGLCTVATGSTGDRAGPILGRFSLFSASYFANYKRHPFFLLSFYLLATCWTILDWNQFIFLYFEAYHHHISRAIRCRRISCVARHFFFHFALLLNYMENIFSAQNVTHDGVVAIETGLHVSIFDADDAWCGWHAWHKLLASASKSRRYTRKRLTILKRFK